MISSVNHWSPPSVDCVDWAKNSYKLWSLQGAHNLVVEVYAPVKAANLSLVTFSYFCSVSLLIFFSLIITILTPTSESYYKHWFFFFNNSKYIADWEILTTSVLELKTTLGPLYFNFHFVFKTSTTLTTIKMLAGCKHWFLSSS